MGIKTKFNPMGGTTDIDKGRLSDWRYNTLANGAIILEEFYPLTEAVVPYENMIYVPRARGKAQINDYINGTSTSNIPFYAKILTKVDLQGVPFNNNSMRMAFQYCDELVQVYNINNSVTDMNRTFQNCTNFNQNIQIPNSVINMYGTFYGCINLNQNIQIPNSVTNMGYTFYNCTSFNQNIQIPNSVTVMFRTFYDCINLNQNIQIPNSVISMDYTFYNCNSLQGVNINVMSPEVPDFDGCFYGSNLQKNLIFPSRYINNANTVTKTSLTSAGYAVGTCAGNVVTNSTQNGATFNAYDPVAWEGYRAWTGNGTHWTLNTWGGIGKAAGATNVVVPTEINCFYDTFPTVLVNTCFKANSAIQYLDCNRIPILPLTTPQDAFLNMFGANSIYNVNLDSATSAQGLIHYCNNLDSFSTGTPRMYNFFLDSSSCSSYYGMAQNLRATSIKSFYFNTQSVTSINLRYAFRNLLNNSIGTTTTNFYFGGPTSIVNTQDWFANRPNTSTVNHWKNLYIYYSYSNGTATPIYNSLKATVYMGTTGNAISIASPHYNSTSKFAVYNLSEHYCPTNESSWWCSPVDGKLMYTGQDYEEGELLYIPTNLEVRKYPDSNVVVETNTDVSGLFNNYFKFNTPVYFGSIKLTNTYMMFHNCNNFNSPVYFKETDVTDMSYMFGRCFNYCYGFDYTFNGQDVNMTATFTNCQSLNTEGESPVYLSGANQLNLENTFNRCTNLPAVHIYDTNSIIMHDTFNDCTNLSWFTADVNEIHSMTNAFQNCTNLSYVRISQATIYGSMRSAFYNCKSLPSMSFDQDTISRYSNTFENASFNYISISSNTNASIDWTFHRSTIREGVDLSIRGENINAYYTFADTAGGGDIDFNIEDSGITYMTNTFNDSRGINNINCIVNSADTVKMYHTFDRCKSNNVNCIINSANTINMYYTFNNSSINNLYLESTLPITIAEGVFANCHDFNSIIINSDISAIQNNSFRNCKGNNITFLGNITGDINYISGSSTSTGSIFNSGFTIEGVVSGSMTYTFNNCQSFNMPVTINHVTAMNGTFRNCTSFNSPVTINHVTAMNGTFAGCTSFNQNIQIPESVTDMAYTFHNCTSFNQNIQIPESVTNMAYTFQNCFLNEVNINVLSTEVTNASQCFYHGGTVYPIYLYIPFQYSNGVNTNTFNSFKTAGYIYSNGESANRYGVQVFNIGLVD